MSATGYIQVRAYTSTARFPLENVAIAVTATDGTAATAAQYADAVMALL